MKKILLATIVVSLLSTSALYAAETYTERFIQKHTQKIVDKEKELQAQQKANEEARAKRQEEFKARQEARQKEIQKRQQEREEARAATQQKIEKKKQPRHSRSEKDHSIHSRLLSKAKRPCDLLAFVRTEGFPRNQSYLRFLWLPLQCTVQVQYLQ